MIGGGGTDRDGIGFSQTKDRHIQGTMQSMKGFKTMSTALFLWLFFSWTV